MKACWNVFHILCILLKRSEPSSVILNTQLEDICADFFDKCDHSRVEVGTLLPKCQVLAKLVQVHPAHLVERGGVHVLDFFQHRVRDRGVR